MSRRFKTTYDRPPHRGLQCRAPSLVQPQFARDTDINLMIQRALGGDPSVFAPGASNGVDALDAPEDFHEAMNQLARGETAWAELPLAVKQSYGSKEAFLASVDAFLASQGAAKEVEKKEVKKDDIKGDKIVTSSEAEASKTKSAE